MKSSLAAETLKQEMEQLKRKCNEDLSKEKLEENKVAAEREVRISELMAANKVRKIYLKTIKTNSWVVKKGVKLCFKQLLAIVKLFCFHLIIIFCILSPEFAGSTRRGQVPSKRAL